jgi:dTDP-4-amino-4,6-dideoxygalactose transaminase
MLGHGMFDKILKFEQELAEFAGAPYAIMTDCCTHAIELCLRYDRVTECSFTPYTYLSVPMTMHKLGIRYQYHEHEWQRWIGEYPFVGTRIWDSARRLEPRMYRPGTMQCLSFGHSKPLHIGRGGAILLDDPVAYHEILLQRYDGRDLNTSPWQQQQTFRVGYHYRPTPEEAELGSALLQGIKENPPEPKFVEYPDLRTITIKD